MAAYGNTAGVTALTAHIDYNQDNAPTTADVEGWLVARSGVLNSWLALAGFVTPVVLPEAKAVLDRFANYGAAADAEASQRTAGYREDDEDRREVYFAREFRRAEDWIASGALAALGVPQSLVEAGGQPRGARVGQLIAGGPLDPRNARQRGGLR